MFTTIVEIFDPYNLEHLEAYKVLLETGVWPVGFVPEGTVIPSMWQIQIAHKMAEAWIESALAGSILGMPNFSD